MKKSLFATALVVALVGCGQSSDDRMGSAASTETDVSASRSQTEIRQQSTLTNDASGISGSGSIESANSGAAAGSLESTNNISTSTSTTPADASATPPQPQTPPAQPEGAANTTGDQTNGDTSNRPAGAPGGTQPSSSSEQQPQPPSSSATP